jgi:hypothetical protein
MFVDPYSSLTKFPFPEYAACHERVFFSFFPHSFERLGGRSVGEPLLLKEDLSFPWVGSTVLQHTGRGFHFPLGLSRFVGLVLFLSFIANGNANLNNG